MPAERESEKPGPKSHARGMDKDVGFRKRCARTLDVPLTFFGLETADLIALMVLGGFLAFAVGSGTAVAVSGGAWFLLSRIKRGKPPGHLVGLLYRWRILAWIPVGPPHLVRPAWDREGRLHFSAVTGEVDRTSAHARFYWRRG